ncbi:hypothetical protein OIB37_27680 [Streptomyces sp. NBC_00820]|uniref:hypothetical protein n=1 Tax=Streptomyces sp. NBC_00820 TaxID=2975842 RepID=UPI002ED40622|nr:hypothetical protein OIB37_27680 [Streptomyces sp. NBC_00820]
MDALPVIRWEMDGSSHPPPGEVDADWHGDPRRKVSDYPSGHAVVPVLSRRLAEETRRRFEAFGNYIPVRVPEVREGAYLAYIPSVVADCLDRDASSPPSAVGEIEHAEFVPEGLPHDAPCFRLTDNRTYVYWNGWAARLIQSIAGPENVELRLVWSSDPGATPHPRPMGF